MLSYSRINTNARGYVKVDRPKSKQQTSHRPQSNRSQHQPSSSRHGRPPSSQERSSSSQSSSQDYRQRQSRHGQIPSLTILEEVPEDSTIRTDISTLYTLIDQHAEYFYANRGYARGIITERILTDIVEESRNGIAFNNIPISTFILTYWV